jgi:uncharacterized protein YjbJ (UPF0337 family)
MTESNSTPIPQTGNWAAQKTKLKAEFPILTDADLQYEEGKKEEMLSRVQEKIGKTKDELAALIATV